MTWSLSGSDITISPSSRRESGKLASKDVAAPSWS